MVKICRVLLNNDVATVIEFDGAEIQLSPIHRNTEYVRVQLKDGIYRIVDNNFKEEIAAPEKSNKKVESNKKTTNEKNQIKKILDKKENA
ncbi:MAG: hypothetical protein II453_18065 [Alphaproteobacteria bacterium]|jgi:hypothetical protein|nr:hypothetical protein [Alphaproteobacteria bacterium]